MQIKLLEVLNAYQTQTSKAYVTDLLIKFNVFDVIKMQIIEDAVISGYSGEISVVISNVYKRFNVVNPLYETASDLALLKAYAICFARVIPVEEYPNSLNGAIKKLIEAHNYFKSLNFDYSEITDLNSLAAVLYERSKIKTIKENNELGQQLKNKLIEKIQTQDYFEGIEYYINYIEKNTCSTLDFFDDYVLIFKETSQILSKYKNIDDIMIRYKPRDEEQMESLRFMIGVNEYQDNAYCPQLSVNLNTGKGKTYCSVATICYLKYKSIIITASNTL